MSRKKQQQNETMTPMQHRAVLVCILCVLAVLLTFGITTILLKKGGGEPAPSVSEPAEGPAAPGEDLSGHYQIDNASTALLTETADAGTDYLNDTLFLGDSNTVRLYNNGLISLQQFCAKEGIGTQVALNEGIVTFKKDSNHYTIPQAVAMMKPRRVVMTFGTNDTGMEVPDFIAHYTALIQAIQQSYPYTDIIVNTVPPVPADHSNYPHMDQAKIDDFNMALLDLCEQLGVRFLNSAEALKGSDGYGIADYYTSGDIHLKSAGLKAVLNYLRTHALQTEDRRPDTNNIPTRTMEYVSNPSSAVAAPSSEAVSSSESQAESASGDKKYEARYRVDKNGGGTLSVGNDTGNSSVTYTVTDPDKSITVTAVPAEGHVFVKWSDGLTSKTRTDTDFKQNLDVTAVFGTASVHITSEGKGAVGSSYTFKAALSGKYAKTENLRWYANGQEVTQAAGKSSITVVVDSSMANASYKIHAVVTYNDCKVSSNTLTITIGSGVTSESGSTSSSSSSHAGSSGSTSSSSSSASSGSSSHSTSSSSSASSSTSSGSSKAESESESKAESKAESKTESKAESKAESEAESKSESKAESKAESKSEASASKEAESKAE
jgi:lysophospholipase L1-like esterase